MDRRRYLHQFLALFTGTAAAQVFNLASYPMLARLYTPAEFGVFGTFIAASAIPGALACGRFELALATAPRSGRRAMLWLCYCVALTVALVATVLLTAYWWYVKAPSLGLLAPMLFVAVLLTGVTNATTMYLMRHDAFRFASVGVVVRTAVTVLCQLAATLVQPGATGLIVGFCLGLSAQALLGLAITRRAHGIGRPRFDQMRAMFRRFRAQVSVDIPGSLLAALAVNLIPFFLQALYGVRSVGFFSVGQRIAVLPLQLFNDSLSQVFFQRAARAQDERGEFWAEFRLTLLWSGLISLAMLAGLMLLARPVISLYLGVQWTMAGTILVILAPMLAVRSVTMSLATSVFVLKKPAWLLIHNAASVAAMALAFGYAWAATADLLGFLTALAVLQGAEYLVFGAIVGFAARNRYLSRRAGAVG
ncbi:MAG: oligosaccharide flippase family protein [Pseudomonadota bacterium]|nr:oligosaccharide flippase family protein [Pseudomonadota bacterium]